MMMPNRNIQDANGYRYAYQGQEKDPETGKEAFELRLWDGRIGRWLSPDPYSQYNSTYLGMGNNPISNIDFNGGVVVPADNAETRALIAKVMKSPILKAIYERLHKSKTVFHINVSKRFSNKVYGVNAKIRKGGVTGYSQNDNRINILIKYSKNTAFNIAALADELKTGEQFEDYKIGFDPVDGLNSETLFYDPIDEIETKRASILALNANGMTIDQMDKGMNSHSAKIMRKIQEGLNDRLLINFLMTTGYKTFFNPNIQYQNRTVPSDCKCVNPRTFEVD